MYTQYYVRGTRYKYELVHGTYLYEGLGTCTFMYLHKSPDVQTDTYVV